MLNSFHIFMTWRNLYLFFYKLLTLLSVFMSLGHIHATVYLLIICRKNLSMFSAITLHLLNPFEFSAIVIVTGTFLNELNENRCALFYWIKGSHNSRIVVNGFDCSRVSSFQKINKGSVNISLYVNIQK